MFDPARSSLLAAVVPPYVAATAADPEAVSWPAGLVRGTPARRQEHDAALACAVRSLARVGSSCGVERRVNGPVWPNGFVGSLTHTAGFVGAVAGRRTDVAALGIDVEPLQPLNTRVAEAFCDPQELSWLWSLGGRAADACRILFSAKEAAYKALCGWGSPPATIKHIGVALDVRGGRFVASVRTGPGSPIEAHGRISCDDCFIVTGVTIPA